MTSQEIRKQFIDLCEQRGHAQMPPSSLVPEGDPSVLFTTAGMQQFKTYYGQPELAPYKRVCSIQPSFRTVDIEEVGDDTHLTLFEMLGFFTFGYTGKESTETGGEPYFKEIAIKQAYEFYWNVLKIDPTRLYVTIFPGREGVPADEETEKIWRSLGLSDEQIKYDDNFWGPTGDEGPCGPSTEVYIDDVECGNVVFNQYYRHTDGSLTPLEYQGVDTGLGLERIAIMTQGKSSVYETDLFAPVIEKIRELTTETFNDRSARIIADHLKGSMFLIADGVRPSNKSQGYILRRLIRRLIMNANSMNLNYDGLLQVLETMYNLYSPDYDRLAAEYGMIQLVLKEEADKFQKTLQLGLKEYEKAKIEHQSDKKFPIDVVFRLFDTYGFPVELTKELAEKDGYTFNETEFADRFKAHQETSRAGLDRAFKGGLADHEPKTIKHHTAHHLLLAALRQVLGDHVVQRGSNVTAERLRIDFSHPEKVTPEQLAEVEQIVNQKIAEDLEVRHEEMPKAEAEKLGAQAEFGAKYGDIVSVYTVFNKDDSVFSREFCGGPHVNRTSELGKFTIMKEEASSSGVRRIKAKVE
jgi:alanyl-tRNA synthetase